MSRPILSILPALLAALLLPSPANAATPGAGSFGYVEVSSYLSSDDAYEAWYGLRGGLARNFDEVCGDTFCEGDYSNLQPLRFQCSVRATSGRIGMCNWTFAASNEEIDPRTGEIDVDAQAWRCAVPLSRGTTVEELLAALAGARPLHALLPSTSRTIYDALVDCL